MTKLKRLAGPILVFDLMVIPLSTWKLFQFRIIFTVNEGPSP